jgi:hypothetical protein
VGISIWEAAKAGWKVSLRCDRRREGLKSVRPCAGERQVHLPTLIAAWGPEVDIAELQKRLQCPVCGSDRFSLQIVQPPGASAGKKDEERQPRKMRGARQGEHTLGQCSDPWIVMVCSKCDRRGEYRRERLIEEFGNTIGMPDLLAVFAHSRGCGLATPDPTRFDLARARECLIRYDVEQG